MLTALQKTCLDWITDYQAVNAGISPTFTELEKGMGSRRGNCHRLVKALEERGFVRRIPNQARAIEVVRRTVPVVSYPDAAYFVVERVDEKAVLVPLKKANAP